MMSNPAFRCPLCDGNAFEVAICLRDVVSRAAEGEFQLVRCSDCELLRLYPAPDAATLEAAYRADYTPYRRRGLAGWAKALAERRMVRDLWGYLRPPRRVVDVGCAGGGLLAAIRRAGNSDLLGIEPDPGAAAIARGRGLQVLTGTLEDQRLPDESVSTVIMSHVLEHVPDPGATLGEVRRVLIDGGALVLALPNVDSWAARWLGQRWIGYDVPRHLTTFSVRTLSVMLDRQGFRFVRIDHEWTGIEWAWGLRLLARDRWPAAERVLRRLHVGVILATTPLGYLAARRKRSGRIIVVAVKRPAATSESG